MAPKKMSSREVGAEGERLAASYLMDRGYDILELNWVSPHGEADIIAYDGTEEHHEGGATVLVEVKSRFVGPEEYEAIPELAVDEEKQKRYTKIALDYMGMYPEHESVRFDVVAVNVRGKGSCKLRHLLGAYCWDEQ